MADAKSIGPARVGQQPPGATAARRGRALSGPVTGGQAPGIGAIGARDSSAALSRRLTASGREGEPGQGSSPLAPALTTARLTRRTAQRLSTTIPHAAPSWRASPGRSRPRPLRVTGGRSWRTIVRKMRNPLKSLEPIRQTTCGAGDLRMSPRGGRYPQPVAPPSRRCPGGFPLNACAGRSAPAHNDAPTRALCNVPGRDVRATSEDVAWAS